VHADVLELGGNGLGERDGCGSARRAKLLGDATPPVLRRGDGTLRGLERVGTFVEAL
jgi:hypothetical protein